MPRGIEMKFTRDDRCGVSKVPVNSARFKVPFGREAFRFPACVSIAAANRTPDSAPRPSSSSRSRIRRAKSARLSPFPLLSLGSSFAPSLKSVSVFHPFSTVRRQFAGGSSSSSSSLDRDDSSRLSPCLSHLRDSLTSIALRQGEEEPSTGSNSSSNSSIRIPARDFFRRPFNAPDGLIYPSYSFLGFKVVVAIGPVADGDFSLFRPAFEQVSAFSATCVNKRD